MLKGELTWAEFSVSLSPLKRLVLVLSILAAMLVAPPVVSSADSGGLVVKGTVVRQANATVGTIGKSAATGAVLAVTCNDVLLTVRAARQAQTLPARHNVAKLPPPPTSWRG